MGAVLWRWRQVAGVSLQMSGFEPRQSNVELVLDKVAVSGLSPVISFSPLSLLFLLLLRSLPCHYYSALLHTDLVIFNVLLTCILIYPYDINKQDELFSINLFQFSDSTCFEQACCSSSGGSPLYKQQLVWLCVMLTGCWQQPVNIAHDYTSCCLYRADPPDDKQQACSKHVEAEH